MINLKKVYDLPPQVRQAVSKSANANFKIDSAHKKGILVFDTSKIMIWPLDYNEKSSISFLSLTSRSSFIGERPFEADNVFIFGPESADSKNLLSVIAIHPLGTVAYWRNAICIDENSDCSANPGEIYVIPPTRSIEYALTDDYFDSAVPCVNDVSNDVNEFLVGSERGAVYKVIVKPFLAVIEIYKSDVFRNEIAARNAKAEEGSSKGTASSGFFGLLKYGWWQSSSKGAAAKVPQDDKFCCFVDTRSDLAFITEKWLVVYSAGSLKDIKGVDEYAASEVYSEQKFLGASLVNANGEGSEFAVFITATRKDVSKNVLLVCTVDGEFGSKVVSEVVMDDDKFGGNGDVSKIVLLEGSLYVCLAGNTLFSISNDGKLASIKEKTQFVSLSKSLVVSKDAVYCFTTENVDDDDDDVIMDNNNEEEKEKDDDDDKDVNINEEDDDISDEDEGENNDNDINNEDVINSLFKAVVDEDRTSFNKTISGNISFENRKECIAILSAVSDKLVNCGCDDLPKWYNGSEAGQMDDILFGSKFIGKKYALHNMMFVNWIGKEFYANSIVYNTQLLEAINKFSAFQIIIKNK